MAVKLKLKRNRGAYTDAAQKIYVQAAGLCLHCGIAKCQAGIFTAVAVPLAKRKPAPARNSLYSSLAAVAFFNICTCAGGVPVFIIFAWVLRSLFSWKKVN